MRKPTDSPSRAHRQVRRSALPPLPHQPGGIPPAHEISHSLAAPARLLPHRRHLLAQASARAPNPDLSRLASTFPFSTPHDQEHAHPTNASMGSPIGSTGSLRDHLAFSASTFPPEMPLSRPSGSRSTKWAKLSTPILLTCTSLQSTSVSNSSTYRLLTRHLVPIIFDTIQRLQILSSLIFHLKYLLSQKGCARPNNPASSLGCFSHPVLKSTLCF